MAPWVSNTSTKVAPSGGDSDGGVRADRAGCAAAVLDQDRRLQVALKHRLGAPRDQVGGAARRKRDDDADGLRRPALRAGGKRRPSHPHRPTARIASARHNLFIVVSRQVCCVAPFTRQRVYSAARRRSISIAPALIRGMSSRPNSTVSLKRIEAADQERVDAEHVVFQHRVGDLLRRADEARGVAERAGHARDRHPQPLVMDVLVGEAHQPLAGVVDRPGRILLPAPALLAGHLPPGCGWPCPRPRLRSRR